MGFSFVTEIPSPDVIRERFPLAPELAARKKERDEETVSYTHLTLPTIYSV